MSPKTIKRLFPNASASLFAANDKDYSDDTGATASVERNSGNAPLAKGKVQEATDGRILVRVTSVRRRLADEDGLCEKYIVDCCRYAGLIPDDAPGICKIEVGQRKTAKDEAEHTQIEILIP